MPVYNDVEPVEYYYGPEKFVRNLYRGLNIDSVLDVGAGHGGVFDYDYLTRLPLKRRAACDIFWIRPMGQEWDVAVGVDVCHLVDVYGQKSFDMVQCFEVLEHVPDNRRALEQLCAVARKLVVISSADESQHRGPEQEAIEKFNKHQAYTGQPQIADLRELGFHTHVEHLERKQIVAWKYL